MPAATTRRRLHLRFGLSSKHKRLPVFETLRTIEIVLFALPVSLVLFALPVSLALLVFLPLVTSLRRREAK